MPKPLTIAAFTNRLIADAYIASTVSIGLPDTRLGTVRLTSFHLDRLTHAKVRADLAGFDTTLVTVEPGWHSMTIQEKR